MIACTSEGCGKEGCVQLTDRELSVCESICSSSGAVTFGEIKQRTELHQELVSRIVRRLVVHGLVEKSGRGYLGKCGQ